MIIWKILEDIYSEVESMYEIKREDVIENFNYDCFIPELVGLYRDSIKANILYFLNSDKNDMKEFFKNCIN